MQKERKQGDSQKQPQLRLERGLALLARVHVTPSQPLLAAFHKLARIVVPRLGIGRFSIWLSTTDHQSVRQFYLFNGTDAAVSEGTILRVEDFPHYFAALRDHRTLSIESAEDETVRELLETYLQPLGVGALLDAPIFRAGAPVGIVCHEHMGTPRVWTTAERVFASAVADVAARLFEESARYSAERSLDLYRHKLMELTQLEALGRLAAGVAHDVNNVLMVISSNFELLTAENHSPQDAEIRHDIVSAIAQGRKMTSELMQFGRDSTKRPAVHSLETIVAEVVHMSKSALGSSCTIKTTARAPMSRVFIDSSEMSRVLLNLLINARDAMKGVGEIDIDIGNYEAVEYRGDSQRCVGVTIRDRGVGMDSTTRAQMFDPFFTTKGSAGNGLGLAIAQQIVLRAGGFFVVESEPGVGTAVSVMLPPIE